MNTINLETEISARYKPFLDKILEHHQDLIHSIHIVGSALTRDFDPKNSDINSVVVLENMNLKFLEFLAPLGKKYGKKRIAAPLIMTPEYIDTSLDVFPIEFFNIQKLHYTIFGKDVFQGRR
jgi:predicted nucleotidyltransferase